MSEHVLRIGSGREGGLPCPNKPDQTTAYHVSCRCSHDIYTEHNFDHAVHILKFLPWHCCIRSKLLASNVLHCLHSQVLDTSCILVCVVSTLMFVLQGVDVYLKSDGSGAGIGGAAQKDVMPPLMPGLKARQNKQQ